jgi:uncharacterized membrane protein YeaQ/YmgE (transglycosylase-associated protein family)
MSIISWIVLGGLAGWIASLLLKEQRGCLANVIIGILGAVIGGLIFSFLGGSGVTGFNLWSVFVSVVGALILLAILGRRHR